MRDWVVLCVLAGCPAAEDDTHSGGPPPTDSDSGATDTGTPTEPTITAGALAKVGYRVHDTFRTLIYATWEQAVAGETHVEFSFDDGVWLASPVRTTGVGAHEEVLLGAPYDAEVTFRVVLDATGGTIASKDLVVQTDPLPPIFPKVTVHAFDPKRADLVDAPYLFTSIGGNSTFAFVVDRQGRAVWALRYPNNRTSLHPRVAKDARSLFLDYNSYWSVYDGGAGSTISQVLLDGTVLHAIATPGMHHPFTDLPDGSVAYGEATGGYGNEYLTVVHPDDSSEQLFDCEAWLDAIGVNDFCMSNTLNYDPATNKYLFSMWSMEGIIEVDGTSGAVDRWFGHIEGAYVFDPANSAFWWQHGGYLTDAGTLLTSSDKTSSGVETVVREYDIDDANATLHEVWNFGVGEGVYGGQMGEAIRLPGGNTIHNYGELPRIREATPDKQVVWDIEWDSNGWVGRSMPVADLYALMPPRL